MCAIFVSIIFVYANIFSAYTIPEILTLGNAMTIIDARSGPDAFERYQANHLAGALHADLDKDLSEKPKDPAYGGRHPLPDVQDFAAYVGKLGITPATPVIVYDDKNGANAAASFWWMLRALGHEKVQVVDGGLEAIIREGLPMTSRSSETVECVTLSDRRVETPNSQY